MGQVYRATDTKLERDRALKIMPRAFTEAPDPQASLHDRSMSWPR